VPRRRPERPEIKSGIAQPPMTARLADRRDEEIAAKLKIP
jgi:hypothetical protein